MTLAAKITEEIFNGLDDILKKEYVKKDDKYLLDVKPVDGFALENVDGLKTSLAAVRTERDAAKSNFTEFEGISAVDAKKAIKKVKEYANFDPDQKIAEGIQSQKEQLIAEHNKVVDEQNGKIEKLTSQVSTHLIDATATTALNDAKGSIALLLPTIKNQVKMTEIDGRYVAQVIDANGNARIGNTNGDSMTVTQLVTEMKEKPEYAGAFEGTGSSGTDTKPAGSNDKQTITPKPGSKTISINDQDGLDNSLEGMASGETTVNFEG